ncbi:hydrolase 1, exosortase A system-associated [Qipengyuania nanhaisediminis]|uniref:hydrolase 1, exosortase A system-associated n=1 Tax=Qipengyuania nanhaisediminis TaxID=604088 RepID=UPI0038B3B646
MSRLHFTFGCKSLALAGTLDTAPGSTGLLIVTGGNEVRSGAYSSQSRLAARIAKAGFPVFRFDRRGVGDSEGENRGFKASGSDISAALEAFRAMAPQVQRVVAFGNCDAASALMLAGGAGFDGLILSNPWVIESDAEEPVHAPSAIRARYLEKLTRPGEIMRLLRGGVDLRKLARGLARSVRPGGGTNSLAQEVRAGLDHFEGGTVILLATGDRTAQVFESSWDANDPRIHRCPGADHSYSSPDHAAWLEREVLAALRA